MDDERLAAALALFERYDRDSDGCVNTAVHRWLCLVYICIYVCIMHVCMRICVYVVYVVYVFHSR